MPADSDADAPYGHILSSKSTDLARDTFIFFILRGPARLILGVNQKLTPASSATVHSVSIMAYGVRPSGSPIDAYSTAALPPGNYGWYFDPVHHTRCIVSLIADFEARFSDEWPESRRAVMDPIPPAITESALARDKNRRRFSGAIDDLTMAWIVPPAISISHILTPPRRPILATQAAGTPVPSPESIAVNVITMHKALTFFFLANYFTVDVNDGHGIVVLRALGDAQRSLPTHLPPHTHPHHDPATTDAFLRLHCRFTLNVMLRSGDISEDCSNWTILGAMDALGLTTSEAGWKGERRMAPLSDVRWQTAGEGDLGGV
ncbi:hypothetical protein DFH09DRAFT_1329742 [Mycena vulgaris]|nr:hypothetical protein DFH09DRAFT_1329742 [Mycena vulgaris]